MPTMPRSGNCRGPHRAPEPEAEEGEAAADALDDDAAAEAADDDNEDEGTMAASATPFGLEAEK